MSKDKTFIYTVTGRGSFPVDMLRYDRATPVSSADAILLEHTFTTRRSSICATSVRVQSTKPPTVARWASFGWQVDA